MRTKRYQRIVRELQPGESIHTWNISHAKSFLRAASELNRTGHMAKQCDGGWLVWVDAVRVVRGVGRPRKEVA